MAFGPVLVKVMKISLFLKIFSLVLAIYGNESQAANQANDIGDRTPCENKDQKNTAVFSKVVQYENIACYFIVADSTKRTQYYDKNATGDKFYFLNLTAARTVCKQHLATLAIVQDPQESKFLLTQFKMGDFGPPDGEQPGTEGIALGLDVSIFLFIIFSLQ